MSGVEFLAAATMWLRDDDAVGAKTSAAATTTASTTASSTSTSVDDVTNATSNADDFAAAETTSMAENGMASTADECTTSTLGSTSATSNVMFNSNGGGGGTLSLLPWYTPRLDRLAHAPLTVHAIQCLAARIGL
jgi:hypothetical protein